MEKFKKYWQLIKNELSFIFKKDLKRAIFLLLAASAYLILFYILYMPATILNVTTTVYDQNQSSLSRQLIKNLSSTEAFDIKYFVDNEADLNDSLQKDALVAFIIPKDFEKNINLKKSSELLVIINGSNLMFNPTIINDVSEIVNEMSTDISANILSKEDNIVKSRALIQSNPINFDYRMLSNSTQDYTLFLVLGFCITAFQQGIFFAFGSALIFTKQKILKIETNINFLLRWFTKQLPYFVFALIGFSLAIFIATNILHFPKMPDYFYLYLLVSAFIFHLLNLTGVVALLLKSELTFIKVSLIYTVTAFIISGYTWPLESMPTVIHYLANLLSLTYIINDFRTLMLTGYSPNIFYNATLLFVSGLILFFISAYLYDKKVKKELENKKD